MTGISRSGADVALPYGLAQQDGIVEHQNDGPDPARPSERLRIAPIAGNPDDTDVLVEVFEGPWPAGVVESRRHPAVGDRVVNGKAKLSARGQLGQGVSATSQVRRVVNVAVLDDVVGV